MKISLDTKVYLYTILSFILFPSNSLMAQSNAFSLREDVMVEHIGEFPEGGFNGPIRMVKDPVSGNLLYNQYFGNIYEIDQNGTTPQFNFLYSTADHGLPIVQGMTMHNDILYLVGNEEVNGGDDNVGIIAKGVRTTGSQRVWTIIARTEPYLGKAATPYDHKMSGNAVSPDGQYIYVSSSSRTNHGEVAGEGRDEPLTTIILKIPTNPANMITLLNDREWLRSNDYIYAEGIRNGFDMAFDQNGNLFEVENSGQRDDPEEMNWLREGRHYGFPWRLGGNDNPIRTAGYNSLDDLLVPSDQRGTALFAYDPNFPPIPDGLVLTEPMRNLGPDADLYRDPETGAIRDASDDGITLTTFTSHRSPVGFGFDSANAMGGDYTGDAFMASFSGNTWPLIGGDSEDLLHIELTYNAVIDNYDINTYKIAAGFAQPIDIVVDGNIIWLAEYGDEVNHGLYKITLPEKEEVVDPTYSCDDVIVTGGEEQISITGLTAPRETIRILNANFEPIYQCTSTDCGETQLVENLMEGNYFVEVSFFTETGELFCMTEMFSIEVTAPIIEPTEHDCSLAIVTGGIEQITISNLTAPLKRVRIFDENFVPLFQCSDEECGDTYVQTGLDAGNYFVEVGYFTATQTIGICNPVAVEVMEGTIDPEPCDEASLTNFTLLGTVNQQSFYLSSNVLPWTQAQASCESMGATLATLTGEGEEDFIRNQITGEAFIGLSDSEAEGQFRWTSGESYSAVVCHNSGNNDFVYLASWMDQLIAADNTIWKPYVCALECNDLGGNGLRRANQAWQLVTYQTAQQVEIQWLADDFAQTAYFVVERSADGVVYEELALVEPTSTINTFSFSDQDPLVGNNFYRLRQHYNVRHLRYSNVELEIVTPSAEVVLFPNPVHETLQIKTKSLVGEKGAIQIFNTFGQLITTLTQVVFTTDIKRVDVSNLENGMYYLSLQAEGRKVMTKRFVVEHWE